MKQEEFGYLQEICGRLAADISWLTTFGGWAAALVLVILAVIFPERLKQIKAFILGLFAYLGYFQRQYVGNKFESDLQKASKSINSQLGSEVLPGNCNIKWVSETTRESLIREGKIIVKLSYKDDKNKNFVNAVVGYLEKGLLLDARPYIAPEIVRSSELLVARKIIGATDNNNCIRCFMDEVLKPVLDNDPQLKECIQDLNILDEKGMFMQILLPELIEYGNKLYPAALPNSYLIEETINLFKFLFKVANRELGEDIELGHASKMFNFRIMIIGKSRKIDVSISPYINAINGIIREGYKKIYLLSEGKKQSGARQIVDEVAKMETVSEIQQRKTELKWSDGRCEKGMCYVVTIGERKNKKFAM